MEAKKKKESEPPKEADTKPREEGDDCCTKAFDFETARNSDEDPPCKNGEG